MYERGRNMKGSASRKGGNIESDNDTYYLINNGVPNFISYWEKE